jgi:hypothetical protein
METNSIFTNAIHDAFGGGAGFSSNIAVCGPMLFPLAQFKGKNLKMTASPADTMVSKTKNADALLARVAGTAASCEVTSVSGDHGDPSAFIPADVVSQIDQ